MKRILIVIVCAVLCMVVSCREEQKAARLETPEVSVSELGMDSFTVSWTPVDEAEQYVYTFDGSVEFTTAETELEFTKLQAGGDHIFRIKAIGNDRESEWAEVSVHLLDGRIASPVPVVTSKTMESFTLVWEKVDNALKYEYRIDGGEVVETTGYTVTVDRDSKGNALKAGTDYEFSIRAVSNDSRYLDSDWFPVTVRTELPEFSADLKIEITNVTTNGFDVKMVPNDDMVVYFATLSYSEGFNQIMSQEDGKQAIIEYILTNVENGTVGQYEGMYEMTMDLLKPETGYVIMAVGFDAFDRYDLYYAEATTLREEVPEMGDEFFDRVVGSWTGRQMGYAFEVPYATEDNPDPDPVIMNREAVEAVFEVEIVKNEGNYISYRERNQLCIQFRSFDADKLSLGYKSIDDLLAMGWTEKNAVQGYGPKAIIEVSEDGSMLIEGLYSDTPAYTWDERYRNDVTFMNITCDPDDSYMPSGDSLPLTVELSEDGNQLTISGSYGPGFRYQRSASAGPLWCAGGSMVLTRKTEESKSLVLMKL